jgi:glycosyltransferase involved in cell wall biosynthesis
VTSQTTSITVIIPTYNEELNIARAVRQVLDEPWPATCELGSVIVVDDCSADGTRAIAEDLARQEPRVAVVRNAQRSGKNAGVRAAVAAAHSDIIAVVDADVLFSHGCLSKTISLLIEDPNLMGASCIIKPLPAQSWQERASRSQALLVATLKRQGHAYLSAVYAIKAPALVPSISRMAWPTMPTSPVGCALITIAMRCRLTRQLISERQPDCAISRSRLYAVAAAMLQLDRPYPAVHPY